MDAAALNVIRFPGRLTWADACVRQRRHVEELAVAPARRAQLLLLEHTPVYTLGRTTRPEHLPLAPEELARATGAEVVRADRGGSVTYHGPGPLTAYLILHLQAWGLSLHRHLRNLEEIALGAAATFGIEGLRQDGMTGAWAREADGTIVKFCAIGVGCRRWVAFHGLGLNVDLDLDPFRRIDPCGLGRPVSSLSRLAGRTIPLDAAALALTDATRAVLQVTKHQ